MMDVSLNTFESYQDIRVLRIAYAMSCKITGATMATWRAR